jgi:hypothetical protein
MNGNVLPPKQNAVEQRFTKSSFHKIGAPSALTPNESHAMCNFHLKITLLIKAMIHNMTRYFVVLRIADF